MLTLSASHKFHEILLFVFEAAEVVELLLFVDFNPLSDRAEGDLPSLQKYVSKTLSLFLYPLEHS